MQQDLALEIGLLRGEGLEHPITRKAGLEPAGLEQEHHRQNGDGQGDAENGKDFSMAPDPGTDPVLRLPVFRFSRCFLEFSHNGDDDSDHKNQKQQEAGQIGHEPP